jgi:hypothetical protein
MYWMSCGTDPHQGLKDILPASEKVWMMDYIYHCRSDWHPASVNFTWGINGAVCGASNCKLTLCALNLLHAFRPERDGPLSRALLLVLHEGNKDKDRHKTDKQVCTWCHINYLHCSVVSTASYIIWSITQNPNIYFLHLQKKYALPGGIFS